MICFAAFKYNVRFTDLLAADILANKQDIAPFISGQVVFAFLFFMALMLLFAVALGKVRVDIFNFKRPRTRSAANIIFIALFVLGYKSYCYPQYTYYMAFRYFWRAATGLAEYKTKMVRLENTEESSSLSAPLPRESVLFLHIGESLRGDHAPMNGYYRNTMPRMMKEFKSGNLFSFKRCVSFGTTTKFSLPGIFTPATIADPVIKSSSFIPFLNRHGVKTSVFYSKIELKNLMQWDVDKIIFAQAITEKFSSPLLAHSLLPEIKEFFVSNSGNIFSLYQGEGSHNPFSNYDVEKFTIFEPVNFSLNKDYSTANAYDNTIVCTDDFCGEIIDTLRNKNAVYIYVSDHGTPLGENGLWGRTGHDRMNGREFRDVLCFIWVSDRFKKENPAKSAALATNATMPIISHDYIYHTVLGFYGVRNAHYDAGLDLFAREAKPFAGPLPEELPPDTYMKKLLFE
ncbi:MAG: sulfatase-like hydrolase/transferase [Leptospirales bacterium]|nr:sulfatase-like hydrolase/transferase [Leptospirales bacterium]